MKEKAKITVLNSKYYLFDVKTKEDLISLNSQFNIKDIYKCKTPSNVIIGSNGKKNWIETGGNNFNCHSLMNIASNALKFAAETKGMSKKKRTSYINDTIEPAAAALKFVTALEQIQKEVLC